MVRVPSSSANRRPSAVTRAGPHCGEDSVAFGEEETVQHQQGQAQGHQDHRRGGQDPPRDSTAHREDRRGESTATDNGQLAAAVVTTAVQAAAVSAVKG